MSLSIPKQGTYGAGMDKMPRLMIKIFTAFNIAALRLFGSRVKIMGLPLLVLHTTGAKSGKVRKTPVACFKGDKNTYIIVASAGGAAHHPSWFMNLVKNPNKVFIDFEGRNIKVQPQIFSGQERQKEWRKITTQAPAFKAYEKLTDRQIPVIRLSPKKPS